MNKKEIKHDQYADFYLSNLINALILFSFSKTELKKIAGPGFNPIFELETEVDYAFTPVCFETIFRKGLIHSKHKQRLLDFKKQADEIPDEIWDMEFIDNRNEWIAIRKKANQLLGLLCINERKLNEDYLTIYDSDGTLVKRGEKVADKP